MVGVEDTRLHLLRCCKSDEVIIKKQLLDRKKITWLPLAVGLLCLIHHISLQLSHPGSSTAWRLFTHLRFMNQLLMFIMQFVKAFLTHDIADVEREVMMPLEKQYMETLIPWRDDIKNS
jgi:hypothetical protein